MENIDETYFDNIDSPLKAYILGTIIYNIKSIDDLTKCVTIEIDINENVKSLEYNIYFKNIDKVLKAFGKIGECIYNHDRNNIIIKISSEHIIKCIYTHLNISSLKHICELDLTYLLDNMKNPLIYNQFVKAYIERYGNILHNQNNSSLHITFYMKTNLETIIKHYDIPCEKNKLFNLNISVYHNVNVIDFLGLLYLDDNIPFLNLKLYDSFYKILYSDDQNITIPYIKVFKDDKNAIIPSKCRQSDVGFDLTIIKEVKNMNSNTVMYDTGIKLDIPNGYYVEIVPRSSISKSGYILANSIGIIDQSYRGNLYIALTKINQDATIELPWKCCQMIVKKQIYGKIVESTEDFSNTNRGIGGFGSTS